MLSGYFHHKIYFLFGVGLTLFIACISMILSKFPYLSVMGPMILAIFIGIGINACFPVSQSLQTGIDFSAKKLLRLGIIFMGLRLNLTDIINQGFSILIIDIFAIFIALFSMHFLTKWLKIDEKLGFLVTIGTAICGAAAIIAASVIVKAQKHQTALSVAIIGILGTLGALGFIIAQPILPLDNHDLGVLAGATVQEIAHVVAAGAVLSTEGADTALVVKLGRVILLVPVLLLFSYYFSQKDRQNGKSLITKLPIPYFILGFLAMSCINTLNILPQSMTNFLIQLSVWLLVISMAGLGLGVKLQDFKAAGIRPVLLGGIGFLVMLLFTPLCLWILSFF